MYSVEDSFYRQLTLKCVCVTQQLSTNEDVYANGEVTGNFLLTEDVILESCAHYSYVFYKQTVKPQFD
ncbi:hypothetical protein L1987_43940 [Smallanthus sonchifolius]|uniref:Uncharacterized protein n=1 Tax=Smallanthus sonchifolius TaxID=185202 RepID=A0ACB9GN12_9ASTR|nr:hypothetical protein L1987_43940 [Smallanthus sonchifolius]